MIPASSNKVNAKAASGGGLSRRARHAIHQCVSCWRAATGRGRATATAAPWPGQSVVVPVHGPSSEGPATLAARLRRWIRERLSARSRAFGRLVSAARRGDAEAQFRIGQAYLTGQGAPRYPLVAAKWLSLAAAQDHVAACHSLSLLYSTGVKAAAAPTAVVGNATATRVIPLYPQGFDIKPDPDRAFTLAKAAARRGLAVAQGNLARMYLRGIGCAQDYGKAARWARYAAVQHDAGGALGLGILHEHGLAMPVNLAEAARWYGVAAKQGNDTAATALGLLLLDGRGVARDIERAQRLLAGPAARGDDVAKQGLARSRSARRYGG